MQWDSELVLSVSAVEETPAEPFVSIPSQLDSVVEETPAEPIIVPTQVVSGGQFPLPPLRVLPEDFFRDGPWRFPHQRIRAGQLLCDIILL